MAVSGDSKSLFVPPATKLAHINVDTAILHKQGQAAYDAALKQQLDNLEVSHPWLLTDKLVAKPDQLIKRRGKAGLLCLNKDWAVSRRWIEERAGREIKVRQYTGGAKRAKICEEGGRGLWEANKT